MERRNFMKSGLAGAAIGMMGTSFAMAETHDHSHEKKQKIEENPKSKELKKVADTAYDCVKHANACLAECNRALAQGESSMAECQEAVLSMISVCEAAATNATFNLVDRKLLSNLIKVCGEFCEYCSKACEPHAEHYAECKNCMESCDECAKACKAYLTA